MNVNVKEHAKNRECVRRRIRALVGWLGGRICDVCGRVCLHIHVRGKASGFVRVRVTYGGDVGEKTCDCAPGNVSENEKDLRHDVMTSEVGRGRERENDPVPTWGSVNAPWP